MPLYHNFIDQNVQFGHFLLFVGTGMFFLCSVSLRAYDGRETANVHVVWDVAMSITAFPVLCRTSSDHNPNVYFLFLTGLLCFQPRYPDGVEAPRQHCWSRRSLSRSGERCGRLGVVGFNGRIGERQCWTRRELCWSHRGLRLTLCCGVDLGKLLFLFLFYVFFRSFLYI